VTDSTAGATISSNNATAEVPNSLGGAVSWMETDGMTYSGRFDYEMAGSYPVTDVVTDSNGATATVSLTVTTLGSAYTPISPARVLDTRNGTGAPAGAVSNGGAVRLLVAQNDNFLPASMSAVAVDITVTDPTGNGFITAYPEGVSQPNASTVNYGKGQTIANAAIVPVGSDGYIDLANTMAAAGSADIVVDVSGYFTAGPDAYGGSFVPTAPSRVFDSRVDGLGQLQSNIEYETALGSWAQPTVGVAMNITMTNPKANGYLTDRSLSRGHLDAAHRLQRQLGRGADRGEFGHSHGQPGQRLDHDLQRRHQRRARGRGARRIRLSPELVEQLIQPTG